MKKIIAVLLAMVLACSLLALIPSADVTNAKYDVSFTKKSPNVDGVMDSGEYGQYPLMSFDLGEYEWNGSKYVAKDGTTDEFLMDHYKIQDDDLAFDFYATWDADYFYMCWVVYTAYDYRIPDEIYNGGAGSGNMWEYSCVQFMITPGAPDKNVKKYQTAEWSGDYLEVGLTLRGDDESTKVCWSQPAAANGGLTLSDWDFAATRDNSKNVTTYEVRLPFVKSGIAAKGDGAEFGLTYAVAAQQNYNSYAPGMIEFQDGILGGKNADAAAIMTMADSGMEIEKIELITSADEAPEGTLPEGLEASNLKIDLLNKGITSERSVLVTNPTTSLESYNLKWAYSLLLRPAEKISGIDGYYTIVDTYEGDGTSDPQFAEAPKKGDVLVAFHTDGTGNGAERRAKAMELALGQKLYLFGFEVVNEDEITFKYSNAQLCVIADPAAPLYDTVWYLQDGDNMSEVSFSAKDAMKVTVDGEEKDFSMSDKGVLKIGGTKTDWEITEDGNLKLGGKEYTKVTEGDYEKLSSLVTYAEALKAADYTEETFAAVTEALAAAKAAVEAKYDVRKQADIDAAATALESAVAALEKAPVVEEPSEEPVESADESQAAESSEAETSAPAEEPAAGFPVWAWIVIGVAALAIIAVVVILVLKKKK